MEYEIELGVVCWIKANPHPLSYPASQAALLSPSWIPKVIMGLVATSNAPPPPIITNLENFAVGIEHRAIIYCKLHLIIDDASDQLLDVSIIKQLISGGYTPPFKTNKLNSLFMEQIGRVESSMKDPKPYPGERAGISKIVKQKLHPNTSLPNPPSGQSIIANGLVKFRAGKHTDLIGIDKAGSPFHVPWVWSEFLLTYANKKFYVIVNGSIFPTHSIYLSKKQILTIPEVYDTIFPLDRLRNIVEKSLKLWPVLSTGVAVPGAQVPASDVPPGPVDTHPYTASAAGWKTYTQAADTLRRRR